MNEKTKCILCGGEFTEKDPEFRQQGWARRMIEGEGPAHYSCVVRAANERAYSSDIAPWDAGRPHPALVNLVESGEMEPGSVFEVGAGLGDNALYLASNGFAVTATDISSSAISALDGRAEEKGLDIRTLVVDFVFEYEEDARYDYVFERSFLQTLHPSLRKRYLNKIKQMLQPNGTFIGVIRGPRDPPPPSQPYAFTRAMLLELFGEIFGSLWIEQTVSGHPGSTSHYWLVRAVSEETGSL